MSRRVASAALVALFLGAAGLIGIELASGALDAGELAIRDPCEPRPAYPGQGLDATVQRIVLDGLDGAACELGASREELVLSLARTQGEVRWDDPTIERALRAGLLEAIDDAERRGSLNVVVAVLLREAARRAPLRWLIEGGQGLAGLLG
ncbi:MAG TPA: hypothetical protein VE669_07660 [Actinomycetota bacterium]|nr:hypothetical protein [Actinomycetota bacterium]